MLHPDLADVQAVVFDLDGTLYQNGQALSEAVTLVERLRETLSGVRFLTNTTSKSRSGVVQKLRRLGFTAEARDVLSPPFIAGQFLRQREASAALFVADAALPDFDGVPRAVAQPDYVIVGDLGAEWTFERLNEAFRLLQAGARLLALGRTRYWQTDTGLQLDAGPFVAALEYASGQDALVLGKPAPAFFEAVLSSLERPATEVAVVGDDVVTDVRAAMAVGCRGVLVRTGKFRASDLEEGQAPDLVLDSVADLITP